MSKITVPVVAVIPTGPRESIDIVRENVEAVRIYSKGHAVTILMDDTGGSINLKGLSAEDVIVLPASHRMAGENLAGRLFAELTRSFKTALERFDFEFLLRMDHDALVVGLFPLDDLRRRFGEDDRLGILGRYEINTYGEVCDWVHDQSGVREFAMPRIPMHKVRTWLAHRKLNSIIGRAQANGYRVGEFVGGGVNYVRHSCVRAMCEIADELLPVAKKLVSPEDYIFTIMARAAGFKIGDYSSVDDPLAYRINVLPFSPEECLRKGKHAVHSTRKFEDMDETQIRAVFRQAREAFARE